MEKIEIIKHLKYYLKNNDKEGLIDLINVLTEDCRKQNFISKPSEKKRINAIEKLLKYSKKNDRPILGAFSRQEGKCYITDSYQLYALNEEYLPFDVAKTNDEEEKTFEAYVEKYDLSVVEGIYPKMSNFIPTTEPVERVIINLNDELIKIKTAPKDVIIGKLGKEITVCYDLNKMKTLIDILQIDKDFEVELYGELKPIIVHYNNEIGLILPIKVY